MTIDPRPTGHPRGLLVLATGVVSALVIVFLLTGSPERVEQSAGAVHVDAAEPVPGAPEPAPTPTVNLPEDAPTNPTPKVGDGRTVVSLTFDDGTADQLVGAKALDKVGLPATFYVVSAWIDQPGYLSQLDLADLRMAGHEIGAHTTTHHDLAQLPAAEVERQVCNSRQTLDDWGYEPVSFAYPFTSTNATAEAVVKRCGFDTARTLGGLRSPTDCEDCPAAESFSPKDPYMLKAPAQVNASWTLQDLKDRVTEAQRTGGGWVPLTFHDVCEDPGTTSCPASKAIDPGLFEEFVEWLHDYEDDPTNRTSVATVGDTYKAAMGADYPGYRDARARRDAPVAPMGTNGVRNPSLEGTDAAVGHPTCFEQGGWGTNQATWSEAPGRKGGTAQKLRVTGHASGDAKLMPTMDLGTCAPSATPGRRYTLGSWYTSTGVTQFALHYRNRQGQWTYWTSSPWFSKQKEWTHATWTTPPLPSDATAISFGLALIDDGTLITDDYSMVDPGDS